jgi:glycosyltransferase involved in cell wall biosynthesis
MRSVCIVIGSFARGGAEKQAIILANGLADRGFKCQIIAFAQKSTSPVFVHSVSEVVKIITLSGNVFCRALALYRYARRSAYLFSFLTQPNFFTATIFGFSSRHKVFTSIRNTQLPKHKYLLERHFTSRLADTVIFNSYAASQEFSGFIADSRFTVIHNAVLLPELDQKKKFDGEAFRLLTIGRFVSQKNLSFAIEVCAEIKKRKHNFHFTILGHGELELALRDKIEEYHLAANISLVTDQARKEELLHHAHCYFSTSVFEGTSNSILEAMANGVPVVASDAGDNKYLLSNGAGIVFDRFNVQRVADVLERLINEKGRLSDMAMSARLRSLKFSVDRMISAYEELVQ